MSQPIEIELNQKQALALRYLLDSSTKTICYGGGGGAGKSWLAALWLHILMSGYKNLRFAVCRKMKQDAAETFTGTFYKVLNTYGWKAKQYKHTEECIRNLKTGSEIVFRSLIYLPTDPRYDRFGSLELTGAVIEEAQEITREAYQALKSRVGRQLNKEYGLTAKVLLTCNPGNNFLYTDFYKLRDDPVFNLNQKMILATKNDNLQNLPQEYLDTLDELSDPIIRARIRDGSWDFGELDMATVIPLSLITACLGVPAERGEVTLGIDIGGPQSYSDSTIVQAIRGNVIEKPRVIPCKSFKGGPHFYDTWLIDQLEEIILSYEISNFKQVRIDACGIGQPIYEGLRQRGYCCYPFRGGEKPYQRKFNHNNYLNLRTQALYELKEKFRLGKLKLSQDYDERQIEELSAIRYTETAGKIALEDKKFTRRRLGRSPDMADALAMAALDLGDAQKVRAAAEAVELSLPLSAI